MKPVILADNRIPGAAKEKLLMYGELVKMRSENIVYEAISGHPDVFFCNTNKGIMYAPNTPTEVVNNLLSKKVHLIPGEKYLENSYPDTAYYNALVTSTFIIHNTKYTDPAIQKVCSPLETIHVNQAYCRCTTLALKDDRFITSDKGIEKVLVRNKLDVLYVNPKGILLPGFSHGFFGGICGIFENMVFFVGSLEHFREGKRIKDFLSDYDIVELYDGPLYDGGGLLFFD